MNYRHSYHAGNFADVLKHATLTFLLRYLKNKPKAFFVLDTHAGEGMYDLQGMEAQKTLEYQSGIGLLAKIKEVPESFSSYLTHVRSLNPSGSLALYPGSPFIIKQELREEDRFLASELHPREYQALSTFFKADKQVKTLKMDGYLALKAFLPPKEKRGLVLIDPPFEKEDEIETLLKALLEGYRRFQNGIFMIWYPIKNWELITHFYQEISKQNFKNTLKAELFIKSFKNPLGLSGTGLLIINAPWTLPAFFETLLPFLKTHLGQDTEASYEIEWLIEEKD